MSLIIAYNGHTPRWGKGCYFSENATIVGDVTMGDRCSVWFNAVVRGDVAPITIGDRTNVQDGSCIHVTHDTGPTHIGSDVTIGHNVTVHACTIRDGALIGMGATLLDSCEVGEGSIVAAGALVLQNTKIPPHEIWGGVPAKYIKPTKPGQTDNAAHYVEYAEEMMLSDKGVRLFTLRNRRGMEVDITNYGARIVSMRVDGREGKTIDIVQGFDRLSDYFPENHESDFGAVIGRYANRLAGGHITVEGIGYQLPQNNGPNCLHGGPRGWQYAVYEAVDTSDNHLLLQMTSPDGDNGFPGEVKVSVEYTLGNDNALRIDYRAVTDRPTVINMTNHSYFNLSGEASSPILDHELIIDADKYTPIDEVSIPLGEHATVEGTPMDFRVAKAIGRDIEESFEQLRIGRGYDHNYVLNTRGTLSRPCAALYCPRSGIRLEVYTTAPGIQLYTGNFLDGVIGKGGHPYPFRSAVCLETQQYPDSPNHHWPESTGHLFPDQPFSSTTILLPECVNA